MKEVLDFLKKNNVFYVATTDGDKPAIRPFGAVTEINGRLYIVTNNKKDVYKQMKKNPAVAIGCMAQDGTWLRLTANVETDSRRECRIKMLEDVPVLKTMYNADDGLVEVLFLKDAVATFYPSSGGDPKVVKF
jgi:uncharacterized pyridoxamine 5'-phosphate oxidase family protein